MNVSFWTGGQGEDRTVDLPLFRLAYNLYLPLTERESSPRSSSMDQIWTKQRNVSRSAQLTSLRTYSLRSREHGSGLLCQPTLRKFLYSITP